MQLNTLIPGSMALIILVNSSYVAAQAATSADVHQAANQIITAARRDARENAAANAAANADLSTDAGRKSYLLITKPNRYNGTDPAHRLQADADAMAGIKEDTRSEADRNSYDPFAPRKDNSQDRLSDLKSQQQQQREAAQARKQFDEIFQQSNEEAIQEYPDVANPNSRLAQKYLEIQSRLKSTGNQLSSDPHMPLKITKMAANELGIAPITYDPNEPMRTTQMATQNSLGVSTSSSSPLTQNTLSFNILSASYGADDVKKDVTSIVQNKISNGKLNFVANSTPLGGDPIFGKVKTLCIKYSSGGQVMEKNYREGEAVQLP